VPSLLFTLWALGSKNNSFAISNSAILQGPFQTVGRTC
jgi:hypothetical protein